MSSPMLGLGLGLEGGVAVDEAPPSLLEALLYAESGGDAGGANVAEGLAGAG